jgi:integral membrane protein
MARARSEDRQGDWQTAFCMSDHPSELQRLEQRQLRRLQHASILEASTLVVLLFVAVPLKHMAGLPVATAIVGPLHGLAFLFYLWTVLETTMGGGWTHAEIARLVLAAFIPFGGFTNIAFLQRKAL